jgi:hypothetical protein
MHLYFEFYDCDVFNFSPLAVGLAHDGIIEGGIKKPPF